MQDKERLDNKQGIDKELQAKLGSKFDIKRADACLNWIAECTKNKVTGDFGADLKDGFLLSQLLKHISIKTYKKFHFKSKPSNRPFVCRTHIQMFARGCKELGMGQTDLCPKDLYEGNNLNDVVNHLWALNAICYKLADDGKYKGPFIVTAHTNFAKENKRHLTKEVLNHEKLNTPLQMRGGIGDDSKTDHDSDGIVKTSQVSTAKVVGPKLSQGGTQVENSNCDSYGIIKSTEKASNAVPLLAQAKELPKGSNFDSYGVIVKKADNDNEMKTVAKADV